ncbi:hypothetical protein N8T08_006741 [Aspergillus melleus]|uniref:Uncharacterized protein n=1 Tax=Aspergillus melleus TaxID=138277 RepID=A0ACC3AZQ7_9EURO|nr:hypothetical protein N8T08_006741 [Aspergillus melleus]
MVVWNDQADARLFVAILKNLPGRLDHAAIAKEMGGDCTVSAIQHRIQRIKERAHVNENGTGSASATEQASATPSSPEKRKRGRPVGSGRKRATRSAAKKVKTAAAEDAAEGVNEGEDLGDGMGEDNGEGPVEA